MPCSDDVIVMSLSCITPTKMRIVDHICHLAPMYVVVIAYDAKTDFSGVDEWWSGVRARSGVMVTSLSMTELFAVYGRKSAAFNGKYLNNPSKLGCLHWFTNSKFERMWYFEDDVACRDWSAFLSAYDDVDADLVCRAGPDLPSWTRRGWRMGSKAHLACGEEYAHVFLCAARWSKRFACAVTSDVKSDPTSSHHEVFVSYSLKKAGMRWAPLLRSHKQYVHMNGGSYQLDGAMWSDEATIIAHPVKDLDALPSEIRDAWHPAGAARRKASDDTASVSHAALHDSRPPPILWYALAPDSDARVDAWKAMNPGFEARPLRVGRALDHTVFDVLREHGGYWVDVQLDPCDLSADSTSPVQLFNAFHSNITGRLFGCTRDHPLCREASRASAVRRCSIAAHLQRWATSRTGHRFRDHRSSPAALTDTLLAHPDIQYRNVSDLVAAQ